MGICMDQSARAGWMSRLSEAHLIYSCYTATFTSSHTDSHVGGPWRPLAGWGGKPEIMYSWVSLVFRYEPKIDCCCITAPLRGGFNRQW